MVSIELSGYLRKLTPWLGKFLELGQRPITRGGILTPCHKEKKFLCGRKKDSNIKVWAPWQGDCLFGRLFKKKTNGENTELLLTILLVAGKRTKSSRLPD